ncbi:MAG: hypothetical protein ACI9YE_003655 [Psychroserpens sp.]|jgi:hypothetical protein
MKNIFKIFLATLLVFSFSSCEDSDTVVDQVVADTQAGAVLRTIEVLSNTLNSSIASTTFAVEVEEQDEKDGALLESVDVYVSIRDLTPDNGETVAEALVKTIPASAFTAGPVGLPRATISATFGEAEAAMGLDATKHAPGDLFVFELRLNLTDGRVFGAADAAGIITGGYWASPYKYNTLLLCSPKAGDYSIRMVDNYGDGWQGSNITVTMDGVDTILAIPSYWDADPATRGDVGDTQWIDVTETVTIPAGTLEATWEFVGGSYPSEVEFEIFAPDGTSFGYFGPTPSPGLLPITLCK